MVSNILTKIKSKDIVSNVMFMVLIMQPVLDIVSFFAIENGFNIVTTFLRMLIFGAVTLYAFIVSDKKKSYFIMAAVLGVYWILHMIACISEGYVSLYQDMAMFLRTIQMPVFTLAFITFFEKLDDWKERTGKAFLVNYITISCSIILSFVLNRPEYTYESGYGIKGWFFTGNAQSCILSVMAPLALCYAYRKMNNWLFGITIAVVFANMYFFGTRVVYYSIFIVSFAFIVFLVWNREKRWQPYIITIVALAICLLGYKSSPCYLQQHEANVSYTEWESEISNILVTSDEETSEVLDTPVYDMESYRKIYGLYCEKLIERFGIERVVEKYNYSMDALDIISNRKLKVNYGLLTMDEKNVLTHLFGYEYDCFVYEGEVFDPENDFPAIYFSNGYVGLGMYILFILYFFVIALKSIIRNQGKISLEKGMLGTALVLMLGIAQLSGNVLRRPNVSIYMSVMLAYVFVICVKRKEQKVKSYE